MHGRPNGRIFAAELETTLYNYLSRARRLFRERREMKNQELLETLAYENGLEYITTVDRGNNGYPRGMCGAITGFDSWEQAENFANENGLHLIRLHKRDGWQMYERLDTMWEPFKPEASWYGDAYAFYTNEDLEDFYENEVKEFLGDFDNMDDLQDFLDRRKKLYEELTVIDESQYVVTLNGDYYETIDRECMSFNEDTHLYVVGAVRYDDLC